MSWFDNLVYLRKFPLIKEILAIYCVEIPSKVKIGKNFHLLHRGFGTVIHPSTEIGDRVNIYHQVTIGRADAHISGEKSKMEKVVIEDDVIIFPGAKILGGAGITTIAKGTIIGANAVVVCSTGEFEIWAGVPARRISYREIV